jgi:uncharacterized membrane protein YhaH (DUF805 family)
MSFGEAIQSVFRNYAEFTGRATRPEFWWWALFNLLVVGALNLFNVISIGENADLGFPARRSLGHRGLAAEPRRRRPTTARRRLRLGPPVLDPGPIAGIFVLVTLWAQPTKPAVPATTVATA